jgi:malonyl-CoA/methylmalonyl-CoA synthetase
MREADLLAGGTLLQAWAGQWRSAPEAPLWFDVPDAGARWWTAGEFDDATGRVAERLLRAGLVAGDRVVWSASPSVTALAAHVGALRAGLVVVPVNPAYSEREVAHVVADVRPAAAMVERPEHRAWVERASAGAVLAVGPDGDVHGAVPDRDDRSLGHRDRVLLDAASPDDPALICFTSGTTGAPKGAVLRHRNLLAATQSVITAWRWVPDDRLVHALPVFHAHGLCVGVYGTLLAGASAVLLPAFDPDSVVEAAGHHRASLFFGVPTMYHRLVGSGRAGDLAGLRLCVSGSAPLSEQLHAEASARLGAPVLERYGMTETLMNTSNPYDGARRAGTVGFPLPGVEVRLDDDEVLVRGPNVFDGYWERPEANRQAFVPSADGGPVWFRTGDRGVEVDGYLAIRGRSTELIITGGYNVYPREVEDVLATHPAVIEVAVSGTPSEEWGEVVTAWIVSDGTAPTADELAAFTGSTLADYKRPRVVRIVDQLPRNSMGKVVRSELRS